MSQQFRMIGQANGHGQRRLLVLIAMLLLVGCAPGSAGSVPSPSPAATDTPPPIPTQPFITPTPVPTQPIIDTPTAVPTATLPPSPTPLPTATVEQACTNRATLIAESITPNEGIVTPGTTVRKVWRVENSGSCTWSAAYSLVHSGGSALGATSQPLAGTVEPGQIVELTLNLTAPQISNTYRGQWVLRNPDGNLFGMGADGSQPLDMAIVVSVPATPTPVPVISDWRGEYFDNPDLAGQPEVVRNDVWLLFDWGNGSPHPTIPSDNFSARWTRTLTLAVGMYRFRTVADDGVRVWVDDQLVIDAWAAGGARERSGDIALTAGEHRVRVEYYDSSGAANVQLHWEDITPDDFAGWKGEYFDNRNWQGTPTLIRDDQRIDFNWGEGRVVAGLPADNFSVRWTGTGDFKDATYRFTVTYDDGVRVYLDDTIIIDDLTDGAKRERSRELFVEGGKHTIRVEYYEHTGGALITFGWNELTPQANRTWTGRYYNTRDLTGPVILERQDPAIDFNWGTGSPASGIGADNFSVRWIKKQVFGNGLYRFNLSYADAVTVWLGNDLIYQSNTAAATSVEVWVTRGEYTLWVDYVARSGEAGITLTIEKLATGTPTPTPTARP